MEEKLSSPLQKCAAFFGFTSIKLNSFLFYNIITHVWLRFFHLSKIYDVKNDTDLVIPTNVAQQQLKQWSTNIAGYNVDFIDVLLPKLQNENQQKQICFLLSLFFILPNYHFNSYKKHLMFIFLVQFPHNPISLFQVEKENQRKGNCKAIWKNFSFHFDSIVIFFLLIWNSNCEIVQNGEISSSCRFLYDMPKSIFLDFSSSVKCTHCVEPVVCVEFIIFARLIDKIKKKMKIFYMHQPMYHEMKNKICKNKNYMQNRCMHEQKNTDNVK